MLLIQLVYKTKINGTDKIERQNKEWVYRYDIGFCNINCFFDLLHNLVGMNNQTSLKQESLKLFIGLFAQKNWFQ